MKHQKSSTLSNIHGSISFTPVGGAEALPTVGAPLAPVDQGPVERLSGRRLRPRKTQRDQAATAAAELRTSTTFAQHFGAKVPPPATIANNLAFAAAWAAEVAAAEAWLKHARHQASLAWDYTLGQLEKIRTPLAAASELDPSFVAEFPAFSNIVTARSESAKRGSITRKATKRAVTKAVAAVKADVVHVDDEAPTATPAVTSTIVGHA